MIVSMRVSHPNFSLPISRYGIIALGTVADKVYLIEAILSRLIKSFI